MDSLNVDPSNPASATAFLDFLEDGEAQGPAPAVTVSAAPGEGIARFGPGASFVPQLQCVLIPLGCLSLSLPSPETDPPPRNVVSTVNLDCRVDLKTIALRARNAEYNPKRFSAVIMRIRDPKATALIFATGKMVVTGARSVDNSKLASRKFARILKKLGFHVRFLDFKVQNLVCSVDIRFAVNLNDMIISHPHFATFEPELFPGLIYRLITPKVVALVFVTGKIVLTGAKSIQDLFTAFDNIYPLLLGTCYPHLWHRHVASS